MALETYIQAGMTMPQGWEASEQETIKEFFDEKVPTTFNERAVHDSAFAPKGCSASECFQYATTRMPGTPIALVHHQGCNSYTLICPERNQIIQFRASKLNIKAISEARQMYGDLVAKTDYHDDFVFPVYTYNVLPGQLHVWQKVSRDSFPLEREKITVIDLARFIATASHFPHSKERYDNSSWTKSASSTVQRLEHNSSLKQMAPEIFSLFKSLSTNLHLLDTLPAVLTHLDLGGQNFFVDKETGALTGMIDFDEARTEAFGINIFALYKNHIGSMEDGHWSPYNMPAGEQYPGLSVSEILTKAFWDALWAYTAPSVRREEFEEAVGVALRVGIINRYFLRGMLDEIDLTKRVHVISLDYAKEILLHLNSSARHWHGV